MTGNAQRPPAARATLQRWCAEADFAGGSADGLRWRAGALRLAGTPAGQEVYGDPFGHGSVTWQYGRWTSPWVELPFTATDVIPSWTADAPDGARLTVRLQVRDARGGASGWYVMAHWCAGDALAHRATVPGQGDRHGRVDVDTFTAGPGGVSAYRLAVHLAVDAAGPPGGGAAPALSRLHAVASRPARAPAGGPVSPGVPPGARHAGAWGTVLDVPARSQGVHAGHCPQWDGGGEAWAGPACTAMLTEFFGRGPSAADCAWLDPEDPAPQVDFAARQVYDYAYRGCGNWAFNAAYPARFGLHGMVVRLLSLTDLERFVAAGIPVAASLAFRSGELTAPGPSYTTAGNIVVVCGFTGAGDVVVNDPLSAADDTVRRVYPRDAFARVWLSGGVAGAAYLVHPPGHPLPPRPPGEPPRW
ncbi:C39 family peptidase [Streptomyces sp. V4-01]|uniref:C39 family peptidase n=1 Tax=Actinacidiphila polyblastidii TaxID=3110430 RepID=A0ABU7P9D6_9ACTN|nr:C39 family peptidase [Streptomyces sp. V4-01]